MDASAQEYKNLIEKVYDRVKTCSLCNGMNPICVCMQKFDLLCAIASAKIPYKFRTAKTEQFVADDVEAKLSTEKYIRNIAEMRKQGIGFWLSGGSQSGKTLLICSMLIGAIKNGLSTYYLELNDFYRLQEIRYSDETNKYIRTMESLLSVDFLAIDGIAFGVHGAKQASKQSLSHLIHQRIDAKKPNLIGSIAQQKNIEDFSNISHDFPSLLKEGCPIYHDLTGRGEFVNQESAKKLKFFENLK